MFYVFYQEHRGDSFYFKKNLFLLLRDQTLQALVEIDEIIRKNK